MGPQSSLDFLREFAARQGVEPSDDDLEAVQGFLDAILPELVASRDADVVRRLRGAGAVLLGTLNLHEFAYGALTTSPHFGPARNPWSPEHVCGGSSGGSGAAAAADLAAGTLGTDTGGSIRIPAAFCGVTGLRPTQGVVPDGGLFPVA